MARSSTLPAVTSSPPGTAEAVDHDADGADDGVAAQPLNGRSRNKSYAQQRRTTYRVVPDVESRAKHLHGAPPDSTRLIPLGEPGRIGVLFGRAPDGLLPKPRFRTPAAGAKWTVADAQREVQQYRERLRVVSVMAFVDWLVGLVGKDGG